MYLAKRVGRWSLSQIGRFYNGRHHTTVLHAIEKIEALRRADDAVDALLDVLTASLSPESKPEAPTQQPRTSLSPASRSLLIEAVASRVLDRLAERQRDSVPKMVHTACGFGRSPGTAVPEHRGHPRRSFEDSGHPTGMTTPHNLRPLKRDSPVLVLTGDSKWSSMGWVT